MALIKCPECKKKISDQCENCPNCGYPIKQNTQNFENIEENQPTPLYKKVWFWVVVGIVIAAITTVIIVALLNREIKPKLDDAGKPVFVEMTNEVYTNAENYLGYFVKIKGKVFQVMSDDGSVKGIQVWLDPDTCEQNMMIYYSSDVEVKQGDYISCTGYISEVNEYENAYGATLYAPLVRSTDLIKTTYIDVMSPTTDEIVPNKLNQEKKGYSISIDKVEFSKKETRIYVTAKNNGKASFYVGEAIIVQGEKQYNTQDNYEANYEQIPYELVKGVSASGVIVFPAVAADEFKLTIKTHSDNYDEEIEDFVFTISKKGSTSVTTTPPTTPPTTTTKKPVVTTINHNKEALAELNSYINHYVERDRTSMRSYLIDMGFTDKEASYAISNIAIDWVEAAQETLYRYQQEWEDGIVDNEIFREWLKADGFTEEEIATAIELSDAKQIKQAIETINELTKDKKVVITLYDLLDYFDGSQYSWTAIEYAINNTSGYYRGEATSTEEERVQLLLDYGYTREAIINWYTDDECSYEEAEELVDRVING